MKKELVMQAVQTAKQMDDAGVSVVPKDGTPLMSLVGALDPINAFHAPIGGSPVTPSETRQMLSMDALSLNVEMVSGVESIFNKTVQALADDIAPFVTAHVSAAKNVVLPLMLECEENLTNFLATTAIPPAEQDFAVKVRQLPEILLDDSFLGMGLEAFADAGEKVSNEVVSLKLKNAEAIDAIVAGATALGNDRLNGLLGKWLARANFEQMKRTLMVNFYDGSVVDNTSDLNERGQKPLSGIFYFYEQYGFAVTQGVSSFTRLDTALACYLLATWLSENVQETSLSLADYKSNAEQMRADAAAVIFSTLRRVKIQLETNTMVLEYNSVNKEVVVLNPVYTNWLEQGGSPEVLFGFLVAGTSYFDVALINERLEEGKRAWNSYLMYRGSKDSDRAFETFKSYIVSYMSNKMAELTEVEKAYLADGAEVTHRSRVAELVKAEIDHFDHRLLDDIPHLAMHLVAKARFFFTSAYLILNEMRLASKENPNIDPREAAGLAVAKYIVQYLAEQMVKTKPV